MDFLELYFFIPIPQIPLRIEANAVQVVRDVLDLETALANIGTHNS